MSRHSLSADAPVFVPSVKLNNNDKSNINNNNPSDESGYSSAEVLFRAGPSTDKDSDS